MGNIIIRVNLTVTLCFAAYLSFAQLSINQLKDSVQYYDRRDEVKAFAFAEQAFELAKELNNDCLMVQYSARMATYEQFNTVDSSILIFKKCIDDLKGLECKAAIEQQIYRDLSWAQRLKGDYNEALVTCQIGINKYGDDQAFMLSINNSLGAIYSFLGDSGKSIKYFLSAYENAEKLNNKNRSIFLNNICTVYNDNGFPEKAKEYCEKARVLAIKDDETYAYGLATNTLGCIYNDLNKRDSARMFINEALDMNLSLSSRHYSFLELGRIEDNEGNYNASQVNYNKAIDIAVELAYPFEEAYARSSLSNIFVYQKRFREAVIESEKAIEIYKELDSTPQELVDVYERYLIALSGADEKIPFEVMDRFLYLSDTVFNENKRALLVDIEEKYQNEKLRADQVESDMQLSKQRSTIWGGGVSLLLLALISYLLYKQSQKRKKLNAQLSNQKNQIQLLNQELNHRVKNNLAFMTSLMQMQGRRVENQETKNILIESENRLQALSRVHSSLGREGTTEINIQEYLSEIIIHLKKAFQSNEKKLIIEYNITPHQMDAENAMRLGLIINELITNSIKHVDSKQVKININVIQNNENETALSYKDNGHGIERHLNSENRKKSMGLQLITLLREQLKGKVDVILV